MSEKQILTDELELHEHAYAASRRNEAWDLAQKHCETCMNLCRRLHLLELQEAQENAT